VVVAAKTYSGADINSVDSVARELTRPPDLPAVVLQCFDAVGWVI